LSLKVSSTTRTRYSSDVEEVSEWDVAVSGAGPAGLAAASAAATAGARTVVIERAKHPRYKTCGGGLIGTSVSAVGDMQVPIREQIYSVTFSLRMEREYTRTCDSPILAMVFRDEFDNELRKKAETAGAVLIEQSTVRGIDQDEGAVTTRLTDGSKVRAKVLVGADGSAGVSGKYAEASFRQVDLGLEVELHVSDAVRDQWRGRVLLDWGSIPGSYAWIFPKEDRLTVGVISERGHGKKTREYLEKILERHGLNSFERLQASGHLTRCRTNGSPLRSGRVLLAGDAAGLLEPWTREGISFALRSGALAGEVAASASTAASHQQAELALDDYASAVRQTLIPEMEAGGKLFEAFTRHPGLFHLALSTPKGWGMFVDFCRGEKSFSNVMERHRSARLASSLMSRI
jgi:geranylgeranyl reductase family protein